MRGRSLGLSVVPKSELRGLPNLAEVHYGIRVKCDTEGINKLGWNTLEPFPPPLKKNELCTVTPREIFALEGTEHQVAQSDPIKHLRLMFLNSQTEQNMELAEQIHLQ